MKECSRCRKIKDKNKFSKDKNKKDNLQYYCKVCYGDIIKLHRKTLKGYISDVYRNQVLNSKHRGHDMPTYSKEDFTKWLKSQCNFQELWDNWVNSGHESDYRPSVDRLDDSKGYSFDNIQLVTWKENRDNWVDSNKIKVLSISKDGRVSTFESVLDAQRVTGVKHQNIHLCCQGISKHAGGLKWLYKN